MLRTNLSTRPFYNERAALVVLGAIAVVLAVITALNLGRLVTLSTGQRALAAETEVAERQTAELRQQAARLRAGINQTQFAAVAQAAHEANAIITRRTFSWTELFNHFEATLPPDVRITTVTPSVEQDGRLRIAIGVVSREVEKIDEFIEALEGTGAFEDVLAREERQTEDGEFEATLRGVYLPERAAVPSREVRR